MTTRKTRILLVDDDVRCTTMLKAGLERGGYEVRSENEAQRALAAARAFKPDLMVLDIVMPGKDGDQLAEELSADEEVGAIPIVFLTGLLNKEDVARFKAEGETALLKPISIVELTKCIEERLAADGP